MIHFDYHYLDVTDQPQSIAPTLIAYRIATGISVISHNQNLTPIAFATPSGPPKSTQIISIGTNVRNQRISGSVVIDGRHQPALDEDHVGEENV